MFSFAGFLDLPLIWYGLIMTAMFLYVILDGFDLGVGILFPFAPSDNCRDRIMNSIAPFWDGNETWLIMKTEDTTQDWARKCSAYLLVFVALFMALVSLSMPFLNSDVKNIWFSLPNFFILLPMPLLSAVTVVLLARDLKTRREYRPFFLSLGIFLLNYVGLGISLWPWLVPFEITFWQAAAAPESQSLLLVGTVIMLPLVFTYTGYCYYIFRGKTSHEATY